jgi:Tol biopolymer transport system component
MRKLARLGLLTGLLAAIGVLTAPPAGAKPPGLNGRLAFARADPALGDSVAYTINPDGTHEQQLFSPDGTAEGPRWSPEGTRIADACCGLAAFIVNPDTGSNVQLPMTDPNLFYACTVWSPDGKQLACEAGFIDPNRQGVYTIRSSDGGGLTQITSNPGGDDNPGDYSPDGKRLVFGRLDADNNTLGLFVVKVNGSGLKQITSAGPALSSQGDWSPQGNEIVFSQRVTPDVRSSIWVVHADGTGLHEVHVQAQPACGGAFSDPGSQSCFGPRWSPDGKKIVFARGIPDTDSSIYTINADGSGLTQVTHGGRDDSPDWGIHPLVK